ncbi:hypothetical protein [Demequina sp.]|uniref:hypothetical protein n=1 Tax=Demequina sp. TaxID=2050685 RepID=UPI003D0F36C3
MAMGSLAMVLVLVWFALAAVLAGFGIARLAKRRVGAGLALLGAGVVMVALPIGWLTWSLYFDKADSMRVEGLEPQSDPWFEVEIQHDRTIQTGDEYVFGNAGSETEVLAIFQEQHPTGVATPEEGVVGGTGSVWHVSLDDIRYDLLASDGDWFTLQTQAAVVNPSDGAASRVRVPFPVYAVGTGTEWAGVPAENPWEFSDWTEFYEGMSEAQVGTDAIVVPTNRGGTATIAFDEDADTYTVTISDQSR